MNRDNKRWTGTGGLTRLSRFVTHCGDSLTRTRYTYISLGKVSGLDDRSFSIKGSAGDKHVIKQISSDIYNSASDSKVI